MAKNSTGKSHGRFGRFFGLINGREKYIDKDEMVLQFTNGRTTHLHEMKKAEFEEMCDCIQERFSQDRQSYKEKIRRARSSVLLRIARIGINTIDNWDEVNAFLLSPKIAGKLLYEMNIDELNELIKKLEAIARKGGLKAMERKEDMPPIIPQQTITTTLTTNNQYKS
ncbi:MAG: hypothetical protein IKL91_05485 [Bacteroidales bacterium]|nr:hypothetical protein [Bacteroidales bacterium]